MQWYFAARVPLDEDPAVDKRPVPTRLQCGEEVLARWPDDGWYYRGTIHEPAGDSYFVEDSVGNMEEIARQNIISDEDVVHSCDILCLFAFQKMLRYSTNVMWGGVLV